MILPKGVQTVVKPKADGSTATYYYWRAAGERLRLPDDPNSPEFVAAVAAARHPKPQMRPGTFAALVQEYKRSPAYGNLKQNTQTYYERQINRLRGWATYNVSDIRRRDIIVLRDALGARAPQSANQLVMVLSVLMDFAVEREYRDANPCKGIDRFPGGHHQRWNDAQVQFALSNFPEPYRRAVVLALNTGQREGDCCALRWSQYDGNTIRLTQQKTGTKLEIPVSNALKGELDAWKLGATAVTILSSFGGLPWDARSFSVQFSRQARQYPPLTGLTFHGLRMTAAARLAEQGCTMHEIAAITGHKTLSMVQLYTRGADQQRLARSAILKMEQTPNRSVNRAENN